MKNVLEFSQIYTEEYMIEISIKAVTINVAANVSCYTQSEKLQQLSIMCSDFLQNKNRFTWEIGSEEVSYFRLEVKNYDDCGHVAANIIMIDKKHYSGVNTMRAECSLIFELGQIEMLGKQIASLNKIDSVTIEKSIDDYLSR